MVFTPDTDWFSDPKVLIGDRMRSDHHLIGLHITLIEFPRGRDIGNLIKVYWRTTYF